MNISHHSSSHYRQNKAILEVFLLHKGIYPLITFKSQNTHYSAVLQTGNGISINLLSPTLQNKNMGVFMKLQAGMKFIK